LRTPRFLVIIRNAYGGAYASFNNYNTGADLVIALPTTRLAVMGPAGVEFVYKDEVRKIREDVKVRITKDANDTQAATQWGKQQEALLAQRYERELMNPREALSLGSISSIVMPSDLRREIATNLEFHLSHYKPSPMTGIQREFF
jgi:acetyl-CoA carboxylase carboxyltransferase component